MRLSDQQFIVIHECYEFFFNSKERALVVNGVAGSGKTTVIKEMITHLSTISCVVFSSLTNRVVSNMKSEFETYNSDNVSFLEFSSMAVFRTLHSLLYRPVYDLADDGKTVKFPIKFVPMSTKEIAENLKIGLSDDDRSVLLIIDEASMVSEKILDQIMSFFPGKIIFFGDKFQLPPIEGKINIMEADDVSMNQIHRNSLDSDIVNLTKELRETGRFNKARYKNSDEVRFVRIKDVTVPFLREHDFDMILCATNKMRKKLNHLYRLAKDMTDFYPQVGEYVTPVYTYSPAVARGRIFRVGAVNVSCDTDIARIFLESSEADIDGDEQIITTGYDVPLSFFQNENTDDIPIGKRDEYYYFTFAYAMTVHKAQGSEFDNVLFINEDVSYFLEQDRYAYTGITRAKKTVTIATK